jgi:predicted nucleotidyltransferase
MLDLGLPIDAIAKLCRGYGIRELAIFGSAVRGELRPDSDLDLLVEFQPQTRVGFLLLARLARELSELLGRPVDLVPKDGLKPLIRDEVLAEAEVVYAA